MDCGKNTFLNIYGTASMKNIDRNFRRIDTAGRQQFNMETIKLSNKEEINFFVAQVGKYDSSVMPAATLWRNDCDSLPHRYFYNEEDSAPGEYNINDIALRLSGLPQAVDSVMLRPGYQITLYAQSGFRGASENFSGKYQDGRTKDERLQC